MNKLKYERPVLLDLEDIVGGSGDVTDRALPPTPSDKGPMSPT